MKMVIKIDYQLFTNILKMQRTDNIYIIYFKSVTKPLKSNGLPRGPLN